MESTLGQKRLERIILINSSTFRYAEVIVDGNTHIAGDNSVGKSSFLQIAMLFYTGDPSRNKLGIGDGKLPFQQYHLRYSYSYIIYEVKRSDTPGDCFMVVLRSASWPTFTFFDCPYSRDVFFDENSAAYDNLESVKNAARKKHGDIDIQSIKGAKEYLDVLYGWKNGTPGRKLGLEKFSLCTCPSNVTGRPHDRIANLLQMLLSLGKVQGDVLKKMIVSSLESVSQPFNVNTNREGARELLKQYNTIRNWSEPVLIQAQERFVKSYKEHSEEKKAYLLYPGQAKYARQIAEENRAEIVTELTKAAADQSAFTEKVKSRREETGNQIRLMNDRLAVLKGNLDTLTKKRNEFASLMPLIPLIESEETKLTDKAFTEGLIADLTKESTSLKESFDKKKDELDKSFVVFEAGINRDVADLQVKASKAIKEYAAGLDEDWNKQNAIHKSTMDAIELHFTSANTKVNELKQELVKLEVSHPKEKEISDARQKRAAVKKEIEGINQDIEHFKHEISLAEQAKLGIPDKVKVSHADKKHRLDDAVERLTQQKEEQERKILQYKGSFAEWLDSSVEHWTGTIGKVVSENVLLRPDLSPERNGAGDNIFGVSLDMSKLSPTQTTPASLKDELQSLKNKLTTAQEEQSAESQAIEAETNALLAEKDSFIQERENEIKAAEDRLTTKKSEMDSFDEMIKGLVHEEELLVKELTDEKNQEIHAAEEELKTVQSDRDKENQDFELYTKSISDRKKDKEKELNGILESDIKLLQDRLEEERTSIEGKKKELDEALAQALSEKGVAPEKIEELQKKLNSIEADLRTINNSRKRYNSYLAAKEDYFDHEAAWIEERENLNTRVATTQKNNDILTKEEDAQALEIEKAIEGIKAGIDECDSDIKAVEVYYGEHRTEEYDAAEPVETDLRAQYIVEADAASQGKIQANEDIMETSWLKFSRNLGEYGMKLFFPASANCLDIKTDEFAQNDVYSFITEKRIDAHILGWNTHAIPFVSDIFYSASYFKKDIESIREIVRDINRTFKANNFTDVIKRFELSVEEVGTELISLIHGSEAIHRDYCDDADEDRNLLDGSSKNKRFIGYIQSLATKLETYGPETIQIEDMFTLYIEADEGMNKSGRKKEIRELGSNGIDTIFKNILYLLMIQNIRKRFAHKGETFMIHCPVDEQASLSPSNFNHLMALANRLGILILANSPTMPVGTEESFKRAYRFYRNPGTDTTRADCLLNRR